jgi:hypothetical protein
MIDNGHFNDFVKGVRLTRDKGSTGITYWKSPQLELYLDLPSRNISLDSVLRIIERELTAAGCTTSREVAIAILGLLAAISSDDSSASQKLNDLLARVVEGTLHVNIVLPSPCDSGYAVTIGDCHLRPFDPDQLLYWAKKGGSGYPCDVSALRGLTAISPEPIAIAFIDLEQIGSSVVAHFVRNSGVDPQVACDAYFHALFESQLAALPGRVRRATLVLEAGGLIYVDMESLIGSALSRRLGLFRWKNVEQLRRTWAVMNTQAKWTINLPPSDRLVASHQWLETQLGYAGVHGDTPLTSTLEMFCTLMQRGRQHQYAGARDEASLYFVIALELIFGEKGRSTDSVAERVSVLTHLSHKKSFTEQCSRIRNLYDARSKYVHEGKQITSADAEDIERVATEVLWSFLSVVADGTHTTAEQWLQQIDYVQAATVAGRHISESDLQGIGARKHIAPVDRVMMPDATER